MHVSSEYKANFDNLAFMTDEDFASFDTFEKTFVKDLVPELTKAGSAIIEKVEGLAVFASGKAIFSTDNNGVDDASGKTQMIKITNLN